MKQIFKTGEEKGRVCVHNSKLLTIKEKVILISVYYELDNRKKGTVLENIKSVISNHSGGIDIPQASVVEETEFKNEIKDAILDIKLEGHEEQAGGRYRKPKIQRKTKRYLRISFGEKVEKSGSQNKK